MKNFGYLILLGAVCLQFNSQAQNGWVRPRGGVYAQLSFSAFSSNRYLNTSGEELPATTRYDKFTAQLYGEYGLHDRFTALLSAPYFVANRFENTDFAVGPGDFRIGGKYGLTRKFPLAIEAQVEIPTGDGMQLVSAKEPDDFGIINEINLPTSDGEWNLRTTLNASGSFGAKGYFGGLYSGVNWRTQGFSHQLIFGGELGKSMGDQSFLIFKFRGQERLGVASTNVSSFLFGENTTFLQYGLTYIGSLGNGWSAVVGYENYLGGIIPLRNVYRGPSLSVGIALEI